MRNEIGYAAIVKEAKKVDWPTDFKDDLLDWIGPFY